MLKLIAATIAAALLTVAVPAMVQAGHDRCRTAGPVYYQAASQYQAAAPGGYRSFSYEPAATASYGYRPAMRRYSASRPSYFDATSKALGRYRK